MESDACVEIRNLFCYSCSRPFVNSTEFRNHHPYCSKSFSSDAQRTEFLFLKNIEIKLETDNESSDEFDSQRPSTVQNNFDTPPLSSSPKSIAQQHQQNEPPTRILSCLQKSDQIQIHCWICSTGFVSLKTFLNHLDKNEPHPILPKPTKFSKFPSKVQNDNTILCNLPQESEQPQIDNELPSLLFENSDEKFLGEMEDDPLTLSDLESLEIPATTTTTRNINNDTNCYKYPNAFSHSQHLEEHIHGNRHKVVKCNSISAKNSDDVEQQEDSNSKKLVRDRNKKERRFKCSLQSCNKSFSRKSILKIHTRTHTGEKPYLCVEPNCNRQFSQQCSLTLHLLSHQKKRPFPCTEPGCDKSFCRRKDLTRHSVVHLPEKPFKCLFTLPDTGKSCGRTFRDNNELKTHENVHTAKIKFTCPHSECAKQFLQRRNLRLHIRSKHPSDLPGLQNNSENLSNDQNEATIPGNNNSHNFTQNGTKSQATRQKSSNRRRPQEPKEKIFICSHPGCEKAFNRQKHLDRHATIHLKEKPFKCTFIMDESGDICGRTFRDNHELKSHENVHTGEVSFDCPNCSKSFYEQYKLRRHVKFHHPASLSAAVMAETGENSNESQSARRLPRLFKCTEENCDKSYVTSSALGQHMKSHLGVKEAICDICGKSFISVTTLGAHVKAVHEGLKPHLCPHCGRSFFSSGVYQRHLRLHTGETPYECSQCDQKFQRKSELERHTAIHSGANLRKYKCQVEEDCDKAFFTKAALGRHILIHTGEKPFQCSLCPVAFPDPRPLKNHMAQCHPDFVEEKTE